MVLGNANTQWEDEEGSARETEKEQPMRLDKTQRVCRPGNQEEKFVQEKAVLGLAQKCQ